MDPQDNTNPKTDNTEAPAVGAVDISDTPDTQATGAVDLSTLASSIDDDPNITIDSSNDPVPEPNEPKVLDVKPTAPLPGSIGSVTSGPAPTDTVDTTPDSSNLTTPAEPVAEPVSEPTPETEPESAPASEPTTEVTPESTSEPEATTPEPKPATEPTIDTDDLLAEAADTPAAVPDSPLAATLDSAKKPHRSATILSIVLIILLVIACAVLAFLLIQENQRANSNASNQQTSVTSTSSVTTLVCTADVTAKQSESLQPLKKAQNTRSYTYKDGEFSELTDVTQYTFEDATAAAAKLETLKSAYKEAYTAASLTQDPFTTEFSVNDAVAKASHIVSAENMTAKNIAIIGITADSNGQVNTDQDTVKQTLESEGYICASGEVSTTTETK